MRTGWSAKFVMGGLVTSARGASLNLPHFRYHSSVAPWEGGRYPASGFYPIFALLMLPHSKSFWLLADVRAAGPKKPF